MLSQGSHTKLQTMLGQIKESIWMWTYESWRHQAALNQIWCHHRRIRSRKTVVDSYSAAYRTSEASSTLWQRVMPLKAKSREKFWSRKRWTKRIQINSTHDRLCALLNSKSTSLSNRTHLCRLLWTLTKISKPTISVQSQSLRTVNLTSPWIRLKVQNK